MAGLRQAHRVENRHKLSHTLHNWLPILHSSLADLDEVIAPFVDANPVVEIKSGYEENFEKRIPHKLLSRTISNSRTQQVEALTISHPSLYEILEEQLEAPLFPTPISQKIAQFVVANLDEFGFYDGDSATFIKKNSITMEEFERVRLRFAYVEPVGIGAKDVRESFLFQLENREVSDATYALAVEVINNMQEIHNYAKNEKFSEVMDILSSFHNPPNIEYQEDSTQIIPDLMIYFDADANIEVKLNDAYYPTIHIDTNYGVKHEFISQKLKEAKSLVDALEMRKATLYKVGLMIVEYQYDFFNGGDMKPLTLQTVADELGHNSSTVSRAIANKYIDCDRGIFAMREFFTTAIEEDLSNATIKDFLIELIKNESRTKPLSDMKLLALIEKKFQVKIVRRTIAKYRKQLNIACSSERKKLYKINS